MQTVKVSAKISAAGKKKGTTGGKIQITGENIQLASATLDASGQAGGGKILIGGDFMGGNPAAPAVTQYGQSFETTPVPNATTVSVDGSSLLNASAIGLRQRRQNCRVVERIHGVSGFGACERRDDNRKRRLY